MQVPNQSLTQNIPMCNQRLKLSLTHQSRCDVLQIIGQREPQRGVPLLVRHGHVSSSGADGIHYKRELISDGQLKGCLPILSPARTHTPKPAFVVKAKQQRVSFWAFQRPESTVSLKLIHSHSLIAFQRCMSIASVPDLLKNIAMPSYVTER